MIKTKYEVNQILYSRNVPKLLKAPRYILRTKIRHTEKKIFHNFPDQLDNVNNGLWAKAASITSSISCFLNNDKPTQSLCMIKIEKSR